MSELRPSTQPLPCTVCGEDLTDVVSVAFRKEHIVMRQPDGCYSDCNVGPWQAGVHLHPDCIPNYFAGLMHEMSQCFVEASAEEDDDDDAEAWRS